LLIINLIHLKKKSGWLSITETEYIYNTFYLWTVVNNSI